MKNKHLDMTMNIYNSRGFSLVEMLLASLIGIIILGGIMTTYTNTRDTQQISEDQLSLVADARFAIDLLRYDLRHAGMYGRMNIPDYIGCTQGAGSTIPCTAVPGPAAPDCVKGGGAVTGWYRDLDEPIFGEEGVNPYSGCPITSHLVDTDVLVVRYADSNPIVTGDLVPSIAYVRANYRAGELFVGTGEPTLPFGDDKADPLNQALTSNHLLVARAYYISDYTDDPSDGLPSLRRVELVEGMVIKDQVILPGVEDMQVQYGVDTDDDQIADQYVNADKVLEIGRKRWDEVLTVRFWLVLRSSRRDAEIDTRKTFNIAGVDKKFPDPAINDGYQRMLVSSVVHLRNMIRLDQVKKATGG